MRKNLKRRERSKPSGLVHPVLFEFPAALHFKLREGQKFQDRVGGFHASIMRAKSIAGNDFFLTSFVQFNAIFIGSLRGRRTDSKTRRKSNSGICDNIGAGNDLRRPDQAKALRRGHRRL